MSGEALLRTDAASWLSAALTSLDGDALLTSPYLSMDVCTRLAEAARASSAQWVLVTALDASAVANGYLSVQGLKLLLASGVEVRCLPRLHAKCFLLGSRGLVGSADLTGAGLGTVVSPHVELGVELSPEQVGAARSIVASWPSRPVSADDLERLLERAGELTRQPSASLPGLDEDSALRLAEALLTDARDPARELWLKLEYGEPALDGWRREPSWFASPKKGRPGFRPGDLVLMCAHETHDCYAVVEVVSDPEFQPAFYIESHDPVSVERWPWISRTKPRLVPDDLLELKLHELGVSGQGLQNGHVRLALDEFTAAVRALVRLSTR